MGVENTCLILMVWATYFCIVLIVALSPYVIHTSFVIFQYSIYIYVCIYVYVYYILKMCTCIYIYTYIYVDINRGYIKVVLIKLP